MQDDDRKDQLMYFYFMPSFFSFREVNFIWYMLSISGMPFTVEIFIQIYLYDTKVVREKQIHCFQKTTLDFFV